MKVSSSTKTLKFKVPLPLKEELIKQIRLTSEIVWKKDLTMKDISDWLANFKGEVFTKEYEDRLALWLLANFVYYNENEVKHLCRTLYTDFIHKLVVEQTGESSVEEKYKNILKKSRFYNLGVPGESSGYILYYFRQENKLPLRKFISRLDDLPSEVDTIVFIDDVALSIGDKDNGGKGCQVHEYLEKLRNQYKSLKDKRVIILTFIASSAAIEYLNSQNIEVVNCITLDLRHKCFDDDSMVFNYFTEHLKNAEKFAKHYGTKISPHHPLGYKDGQFLFGFFYNTPDNTLPIFWSEYNNWAPIRKRYSKNYDNKLIDLGKYI